MDVNFNKAIQLVRSTRSIVLNEKLRTEVSMKGKADFVTAVDLAISGYLKERLKEITPEAGFMSEEEPTGFLPDTRWILDPIDGTTNLVYDYRLSSVSLALYHKGEIVFGVVYNPYSEETFWAEKGKGARLNGQILTKAPDREVCDSLIEFGAGSSRKHEAEEIFALAKEVFSDCLDLRRMCSSALAVAYVACGRLNGYFEKSLKPWDYAAASLILAECGGIITNMRGEAISFDRPDSVIAGTPKAHAYLLEKFKGIIL